MKNIKKIALFLLIATSSLFVACEADSDTLTGGAEKGGLLDVKKLAITYVVGNGLTTPYNNDILIYQGNEKVQKIEVYKTFTTTKVVAGKTVEVTSNEILFKTISPTAAVQTETVSYSTNYNELIAGLVVDGAPISAVDSDLKIGDYFTLVYKSTLNNGKIHQNFASTKISVGTRLSGTYKVVETAYWRINVPRPDVQWIGQTRIIESVDATTYRFLEFAGPFGPLNTGNDNTHYFTVDANGVVRTPVSYNGVAQVLGTFGVINCEETPSLMVNACGAFPGLENVVIKDDINGKDRIYRTYGYNTTSGAAGPREIYEVLEKVVD